MLWWDVISVDTYNTNKQTRYYNDLLHVCTLWSHCIITSDKLILCAYSRPSLTQIMINQMRISLKIKGVDRYAPNRHTCSHAWKKRQHLRVVSPKVCTKSSSWTRRSRSWIRSQCHTLRSVNSMYRYVYINHKQHPAARAWTSNVQVEISDGDGSIEQSTKYEDGDWLSHSSHDKSNCSSQTGEHIWQIVMQ